MVNCGIMMCGVNSQVGFIPQGKTIDGDVRTKLSVIRPKKLQYLISSFEAKLHAISQLGNILRGSLARHTSIKTSTSLLSTFSRVSLDHLPS